LQANFSVDITQSPKALNGTFTYSDSSAGVSFTATKITRLSFNGNSAQFTAQGRGGTTSGTQANKVTATVNVTDNGPTGTSDTFSISLSTDYSDGGTLLSGNLTID
jgi:type II secretory pathway component HofQ